MKKLHFDNSCSRQQQTTHTHQKQRKKLHAYLSSAALPVIEVCKSITWREGWGQGGGSGRTGGIPEGAASVVCKRRVQSQSWRRCYQLLYVFFLLSPLTHWPLRSPLAQGSQQFDGGFSDQRKGRCVDRGQCRCHITSMEGVLPPLSELTER